ncbi:MAG: hypothetical protein ACFFA4_09360 [Promethearchaeota archaeon]
MEEKREEKFDQEFDDEELDLTKDAFFTDLMDMEEEIATEAYELVEHAINLIRTQYYDDSIEILRQAIGLYTQINRTEEIEAINNKISEVYILKEEAFREIEVKPEKKTEVIIEPESIDQTEIEADLIQKANQLIIEAHELSNNNQFEEALDKYDEAEKILEEVHRSDEIERLYLLIEECYNKKAEYLRSIKVEGPKDLVETEAVPIKDKEKEKKLKQFLEAKKREEEISSKAYELLEQAVELAKMNEYDEAINLYNKGVNLFEELNWTYEVKRIRDTIELLEKEKIKYFEEVKKERVEIGQKIESEFHKGKLIDDQVKEISEQEKIAQMERVRGIELQKMELEFFKAQIDNMATEAARMGREYELAMHKAIKEGKLLKECIYPKVIEMYKKIKELLLDKGWNNEAAIYDNTINVYIQKFEQDQKIRQIEADKIIKQKETEEMLKMESVDKDKVVDEKQRALSEEERQKQLEIQNLRNQIDDKTKRAERLAREYEVALRQGKFELKCPYPEIINLFEEAKQIALERGWETDVIIFSSQIYTYKQKLEKDNRLRQIEADKVRKQEEIEELFKIKEEPITDSDAEKLKTLQEQRELEKQKEEFDSVIDVMINRAESMAKEYDLAMKKAIKKGRLAEKPPFLKIIGIYESIKRMLIEKGRKEEAEAYTNQINYYTQKLVQDNKLREVEAKKAQREKALEEMHKMGQEIGIDEIKLATIERKKEDEDFEKYISENVSIAEKMVRDFEIGKRKAYREGKVLESTPYKEVIEIYKQIRDRVYARGWREQAEIYTNQIKIYQGKLDKHEKLLEVEIQKAQREKEIEEMHKMGKGVEIDEKRLETIERKKEEEDFEKLISENVNIAEKMVRDYEIEKRKAYREGVILENTPYKEVIEIYKQIRDKVYARGWREQADIYTNQIKVYQDKLDKHEKLLEVEIQKAQRDKNIEEMHKMGKGVEVDEKRLETIERKKEEEDFEKLISENVNIAEKMVRDYEIEKRKAFREGKILENTPYNDVIEIYKQIRDKVYARGWREQSEIYANQIKIYQDKLDKHEKLLEVEIQKAQRDKNIEEMHKLEKIEFDQKDLSIIQKKKEEKEFEKYITETLNKAEKLEREFDSAMKKAIKKGTIIEKTPYAKIIEIYSQIKDKLEEKGWTEQSQIYKNQIKIYREKLDKHEKLLETEQQKAQREKEIEEMHKLGKKEAIPDKSEKIKELEAGEKEEDILLDKAMDLIDDAEKAVKRYELSIRKDILVYESPYDNAISNYEKARGIFQKIGWNEEASRLINTIKFYMDKKEKDDKLREIEQKKLKEPSIELIVADIKPDKEFIDRQKRLLEIEQKQKEGDKVASEILNNIQNAERMAQEYEIKIKGGIFDYEAPYEKIIEIYRNARKRFEEINWKEESAKLKNTINFYKEKLVKDKKVRALEAEKIKIREEELLLQQRLVEEAKIEQEKLIQKRKELLDLKQERVAQFETQKDKAFRLMDQAKRELRQNYFDKAIECYNESEKIFININWQEGIKMVHESVAMITSKKKEFELEKQKIEEQKIEKILIEEKLEEQLAEAQILRKKQQEEKRKELLKVQKEKEKERQVSEEAYELLEEGTALMDIKKFNEAYEKFIAARELFEKIGWHREVSRINNELLFKLKREQKQAETLEEIKLQKIEEEKQMALLKEEAKREREEEAKRKKEEKRRFVKEETLRKISAKLDKASKLIEKYQYNEGILMMLEETQRLKSLGQEEEILKINEQVENIKSEADIPIIILEMSEGELENKSVKAAYKALDNAQGALVENQNKRAISELNEANYHLGKLKIGKKFVKEINEKITDIREKLGVEPSKEKITISSEDEKEKLKARIAARREERRKKVFDLLKKDRE